MKVKPTVDGNENAELLTTLDDSLLGDVMSRLGLDIPASENLKPESDQGPVKREPVAVESETVKAVDEDAAVAAVAASETVESDEEKQARLDAKTQEKIDKRIGELTAKAKTFEDKAALAEAKAAELMTKLEKSVSELAGKQLGLHPLMMAESEDSIEQWEQSADAFEEFALEHVDGYEDEKDDTKSMTANQIASVLARLRSERSRIVPKARERLRRMQVEAESFAKAFPQYATGAGKARVDDVLSELPVLKHVANARGIAVQILEGRMVQGLRKKKMTVAAPVPVVLPKATVKASGTRDSGTKTRTVMDAVDGYMKSGRSMLDLQSEVEALMPSLGF